MRAFSPSRRPPLGKGRQSWSPSPPCLRSRSPCPPVSEQVRQKEGRRMGYGQWERTFSAEPVSVVDALLETNTHTVRAHHFKNVGRTALKGPNVKFLKPNYYVVSTSPLLLPQRKQAVKHGLKGVLKLWRLLPLLYILYAAKVSLQIITQQKKTRMVPH